MLLVWSVAMLVWCCVKSDVEDANLVPAETNERFAFDSDVHQPSQGFQLWFQCWLPLQLVPSFCIFCTESMRYTIDQATVIAGNFHPPDDTSGQPFL